jgi:hypothetical protein
MDEKSPSRSLADLADGMYRNRPTPLRSRRQRVQHSLTVLRDDREVCAGGCVGFSPSLLPFLQGSRIDAKSPRKLRLRHSRPGPDELDVNLVWKNNTSSSQLRFAFYVGQDFSGTLLQRYSELGPPLG